MKIERFEAIDRALFWKEEKLLVIGDVHLGYENYLMEHGWSFPKAQMEESFRILREIFKKTGKVKKIILLGDVKHHFGGILYEEFEDFYKLVDFLDKYLVDDGEILITKGNHDVILEPILNRRKLGHVKLVESLKIGDVVFFHGSPKQFEKLNLELYDKSVKVLVTGHYHPAIVLEEDSKKEKYKAFLFGRLNKKNTIILPSFFPLVEGLDISNKKEFEEFEVFLLDGQGKVYDFGKVGKLG